MSKKVFVSGCYDLLHSGHIEFFKQASAYGDLYVGLGSDRTIEEYKRHKPMFPERERLFMVKAVRYVKDALINAGSGVLDFLPSLDEIKPDVFVVNADGASDAKRRICEERGIRYVVLSRTPHEGFEARSSSGIKKVLDKDDTVNVAGESCIPTRLDLAGTWIDQPCVSRFSPGWAITVSLKPTFEIRERCGLSTSTRNLIRSIWPFRLPNMDPEMLARLVFCLENHPERDGGYVSGAQDAIGICVPGLCRHWYDNHFWPEKIEVCSESAVLDWLECHICMIPLEERRTGYSVAEGSDISLQKVKKLAAAADRCWNSILDKNLEGFTSAFSDSFEAQVSMFPAMVPANVQLAIDRWAAEPGVLSWKLSGAGGGGYLALVVNDVAAFCGAHPEAIGIVIRR